MVVRGKYLYYGERSCDIRTAISIIYGYQWSRDGVGLYAYLLNVNIVHCYQKDAQIGRKGSWKVVFA